MIFEELERFVAAHRPCGELTAAVEEPTEIGYGVKVTCACDAVFERWVTPEMADDDLAWSRLLPFPS